MRSNDPISAGGSVCKYVQRGKCSNGERCGHAHGASQRWRPEATATELVEPPSNLPDALQTSDSQAARVKDRCCFRCRKFRATGTHDFLRKNCWYCVDCGMNALDMYDDKELVEAIRFLRSHTCKSQHELYSHNSFLGFGDPTCYNGRCWFSAEDDLLHQKYAKLPEESPALPYGSLWNLDNTKPVSHRSGYHLPRRVAS